MENLVFIYREILLKRCKLCPSFREEYAIVVYSRGYFYTDTNRIGVRGCFPSIGVGLTLEDSLKDFEKKHPYLERMFSLIKGEI